MWVNYLETLKNEEEDHILGENQNWPGHRLYRNMSLRAFKDKMKEIFDECDAEGDGHLTEEQKKFMLAKVMAAVGISHETIAKVLNGDLE